MRSYHIMSLMPRPQIGFCYEELSSAAGKRRTDIEKFETFIINKKMQTHIKLIGFLGVFFFFCDHLSKNGRWVPLKHAVTAQPDHDMKQITRTVIYKLET